MYEIVLYIAVIAAYFVICGLATTNILRLTAGNDRPIRDPVCSCGNCNEKITPFFQLPIISFVLCKGRCRSCNAKIPVYPLILEIGLWCGMTAVTAVFRFTYIGVLLSFLLYEAVRVLMIMLKGRREKDFVKQYVIAVISMLPFLFCVLFISLLFNIL